MQLDGRIFKINATLASWIGDAGTARRQTASPFADDCLPHSVRDQFAPLLSMQGSFDEISLDLRTANGNIVAVSASGSYRKDANGQPLLIRLAFFKATHRRRYERQIVEAHEKSQALRRHASAAESRAPNFGIARAIHRCSRARSAQSAGLDFQWYSAPAKGTACGPAQVDFEMSRAASSEWAG